VAAVQDRSQVVAAPPIAVRSHATATSVLAGFVPGITATVNNVEPLAGMAVGVAAPTLVGRVEPVHEWRDDAVLRGAGQLASRRSPVRPQIPAGVT
jgi:hypothetical protein